MTSNGLYEIIQSPAMNCRSLSNDQQWTVGDYPKLSNELQEFVHDQQWTVGDYRKSNNELQEFSEVQRTAMDCKSLSIV